jgi:DNA polymerase III delta prime subunit
MSKMSDEFLFVEKYRPTKVSECILPERLKTVFQDYVNSNSIPNLMLTGTAGVGKTTVAIAMCEEIDLNYIFINSSEERGIDTLRTKIKNFASTVSLTGNRKVIILDEADYITPEAQAALRGAIEEYSSNCTFIFTCNFKSRLIDALHSRCSVIDFTLKSDEKPKMASMFFRRICEILDVEGIEYDKSIIVKIVEKFFPDYRRTLNELQRYSSSGRIDSSVLVQVSEVKSIADLVKALKEKNFSGMRKWVALNSDIDPSRIYRKIYDGLYDSMKPESIPQAVLIIAKYQYQAAFVADQEINLVACLTEIMVDCEMN